MGAQPGGSMITRKVARAEPNSSIIGSWVLETIASRGGNERVSDEAGNRHRADAARDRRDRACGLYRRVEIDVADEATLAVFGRQAIDSDIDHHGARL